MKFLGIDPGTARIGFAVIEKQGREFIYIDGGLVSRKTESLAELEHEIASLITKYSPARIGLEKLFFSKNRKTAFRVAEARGVILAAIEKSKTPFFEFSPSEVKLAITGDGNASKQAVAKMVRYFIHLPATNFVDDVTDAFAIAIAVSNSFIHTK